MGEGRVNSNTLRAGIIQQQTPLRGRVTMNEVDIRLHLLDFDINPCP
jgi:hypothetical protein